MQEPGDPRTASAATILSKLAQQATQGFDLSRPPPWAVASMHRQAPIATPVSAQPAPATSVQDGVEQVEGEKLTLLYETKRCIHARFCVTGAPTVFLANVKGAWIIRMRWMWNDLVDIAHACPSGAIRYTRDGRPMKRAAGESCFHTRSGPLCISWRLAYQRRALRAIAPRYAVAARRRTNRSATARITI
jgi:uncharacterized Fe-S cluster protein YjdI